MTRRRKSTLTVAAACTLGAGLVISGILFGAVGELEYGKMQLDFEQRANLRTTAIQRGLNDAVQVLRVTNQLFIAAAPVSRQQFRNFTAPLLQQYPFIQAFNYHRVVTQAERPAYEAEMRREFPGFTITEHDSGELRPAGDRASYDVVHFLEPLEGNERAFGLDSAYSPQMPPAIDDILTTGQPHSTGLLKLAQSKGDEPGLVMMMPVYRSGAPVDTAMERKAAWLGDTATVIRAPSLVNKILESAGLLQDSGLALRVYVGAPAQASNLVFSHGALPQPPEPATRWRAGSPSTSMRCIARPTPYWANPGKCASPPCPSPSSTPTWAPCARCWGACCSVR